MKKHFNKNNFFRLTIFIILVLLAAFLIIRQYNSRKEESDKQTQALISLVTNTSGVNTDSASAKAKLSYDHIFIIVMENKNYQQVINNPNAPYINSLAKQGSLATNYHSISSPSLPNYIALLGGQTFGVHSDCTNCFVSGNNLVDQLEATGKTWKSYQESMPQPCFVGNTNLYAQKHNPLIYFDDIRNNPKRCQKIVPFGELSIDLQNLSTTPNFVWITPNLCHDMHNCSVQVGDKWLSVEVPKILESKAFKDNRSLLILTWDEGTIFNDHIPTVLVGHSIKVGFQTNKYYSHYSLLHTIQILWGLGTLANTEKPTSPMSDIFES